MTMRFQSSSNARAIAALSALLAAFALSACFSERATATQTASKASCVAPGNAAGATLVFVRGFVFDAATVRVKVGGSVVWVNCETNGAPHTATSDAGAFNSGTFVPSASYLRTFPAAGTFPYHCDIHPGMKATVIVD